MDKENLKDVPHFELIKKDGKITLCSIFDFNGGQTELFPFLYACKKMNCTVYFENEDMLVPPGDDSLLDIRLALYVSIAQNPKMAEDYARYVFNCIGNGKRTPTVID